MSRSLLFLFVLILAGCSTAIREDEHFLENLMKTQPEKFGTIVGNKDSLEIQIIYTQINRDANNVPSFRQFRFNVDSLRYFYPASTVKLPLCILALDKINALNLPGLDKYTTMLHDSVYSGQLSVANDTTSETGMPSVAHYIKKILVTSDNDAYNRLYEFLGQKDANDKLHEHGYNVRLLHRLERFLKPDQNRHTEAVRFVNGGKTVYEQPMLFNADSIKPPSRIFRGKGFYKNDTLLVNSPFEFTYKNFYSLTDQQAFLQNLLFPEQAEPDRKFNLTQDDYRFIYQYMSQLPTETNWPPYAKDTAYFDAYCKFLMYGQEKSPIPKNIRIFNKVGDAYGYVIDNAYIVDFDNKVEFMLSAVINVNTDGIYNDGVYDYDSLGFPFFRNLGNLIYAYELKRDRKYAPNLSKFVLPYDRTR
ncbi:MAG TPA: serine hydrolase [Cyclobacteriaceae bacterium]|nr:class A beta-lactamase-related serine hydrolase [Cyclobacteriaceae bacterium]HMV07302.1 serine hydrolase [Cyclobacteriaceae bacterium]HMV89246.1 serine hydrolase [Cyclobacteriaceae bacterium]HMW99343.1 serine hydrolase [Cyclobacteriaceae bacterium]HMX48868.1 serine hydrolase [Cyclobacteriaceae bacterium]